MSKDRRSNGRAALLRRRDRIKWAARQHSPTALKGKDRLTAARRSWNMSRIRSKDTTPEKIVRSLLHRLGYRFRLHVRIPIEARNSGKGIPAFLLSKFAVFARI